MVNLSDKELIMLVKSVFPGLSVKDSLCLLVDIPSDKSRDNPDWKIRREIAFEWSELFKKSLSSLGIGHIDLIVYSDVGSNNADLP